MSDIANGNHLLQSLPAREYKSLLSKFELYPLVYAESIFEPGDKIRHVYFPESGIISLLSVVEKRSSLEVGIVGNEGMVGLPLFLGTATSRQRAVVQGAGSSQRMSSKAFLSECESHSSLPATLRRYTHSLISQISQAAACFRFHPVEKRLARLLLMTADRMQSLEFPITQEFLSHMLGVRREAVNRSAGGLQTRGLIKHSRGYISIIGRKNLMKASCSCYAIIRSEERAVQAL